MQDRVSILKFFSGEDKKQYGTPYGLHNFAVNV